MQQLLSGVGHVASCVKADKSGLCCVAQEEEKMMHFEYKRTKAILNLNRVDKML